MSINSKTVNSKAMESETVESPCVSLCEVKDDYCLGCGRSLDEIGRWSLMNSAEKKAVLQRLKRKP